MIKKNDPDPSTVLIKNFIVKAVRLKYFYIACIALFTIIAFLSNKYANKVYEVSATISPVQTNPSALLSSNNLLVGIESFQKNKDVEDEVNNLKSFGLVYSTLRNLNFEVGYFVEKDNLFKQTTELYPNSPFTVNIDKSHIQPINTKFYFDILNDSTFRLTSSQKNVILYNYVDNLIVGENNDLNIDTICRFNETVSNKYFKFSVSLSKEYLPTQFESQDHYYFTFQHLDYLAKMYLSGLKVKPVSVLASIISVEFRGQNIDKIIDFLNNYLNSFVESNLAKKNKIAVSTINFIDSQISQISDSLVLSESKLRNYRSDNQVMDLSFQGQRLYEQMTQIETDRANLEIQERYYNYVINYLKTNKDMSGVVPPSSMNVTDPIMNQLITDLLALNSQRSGILSNSNEKNLFLGQIENKITLQKQTILEHVTNNLNTLSLSLNELNYRSNKLSREISKLPKTELNMVGIQRKFNLNDVIYTFLLQKRSEAAITLASNYPDYEILEPARKITSETKSPKKGLNYLLSLFLGLMIPTIYIFIKDFFNEKITSIHDMEFLLNGSILGNIYHNNQKSEAVVINSPKSAISESFRYLRSNLFNKLKSEHSKVILITSSQPRDGKSFISFNMAASIAAVGYKTIIIDCDLRKPTLHLKFKEENTVGLSNYILKDSSSNEIIRKTFIDNLYFIPAGPILPNPSEMIESDIFDELISYLRKEYEYILIDTAPLGLVADATLMIKYAAQILLITRINYTRKDIFSEVVNILQTNKINNVNVIYNDVSINTSPYKHYTNYYLKD